jgi:hypothetical protein
MELGKDTNFRSPLMAKVALDAIMVIMQTKEMEEISSESYEGLQLLQQELINYIEDYTQRDGLPDMPEKVAITGREVQAVLGNAISLLSAGPTAKWATLTHQKPPKEGTLSLGEVINATHLNFNRALMFSPGHCEMVPWESTRRGLFKTVADHEWIFDLAIRVGETSEHETILAGTMLGGTCSWAEGNR